MRKNFSKEEYIEYLQSNQWQAKRRLKAKQQNYTCQKCHKKILKGFNIHHITYKRFKKERLSDLMFLCEDCHKSFHKNRKTGEYKPTRSVGCPICKKGTSFRLQKCWHFISYKTFVCCNNCGKKIGYLK